MSLKRYLLANAHDNLIKRFLVFRLSNLTLLSLNQCNDSVIIQEEAKVEKIMMQYKTNETIISYFEVK